MPPKKSCSCKGHNNIIQADDNSPVLSIKSCKKFRKAVLSYLISEGLLEAHHRYLCNDCYEYGVSRSQCRKYTVEELCTNIVEDTLDEKHYIQISEALGQKFRRALTTTITSHNMSDLTNLNAEKQLFLLDKGVIAFLKTIASDKGNNVQILNAYEHLANLCNSYYIGALNFALNLLFHFITGSRQVLELRSKYSPSGSYKKALDFLSKQSENSIDCIQNQDTVIVFDNNQVMARSWNVKFNSKALISVITTVAQLIPPKLSTCQFNPTLKPYIWLNDVRNVTAVNVERDNTFRHMRNTYIETILKSKENVYDKPEGPSERKILKLDHYPVENNIKTTNDPYACIESHVCGKTDVHVMDPIMVNPCSFNSLETVLDSVLSNKKSEWVAITCDGLPYNLCSKMIENYFVCSTCNELFKKKSAFENHIAIHPVENIGSCQKYGCILLIPGLGHMEINITKAMFKLLWTICIKRLAIMLGWTSIKAITSCEKCTDHHKAWQILQIFFKASTDALLGPYVKYCQENNIPVSVAGLYTWCNKQSKVYHLFFKCTFTYMFALDLFRKSVRRANFELIAVALHKLSQLFYGLNMTVYMDIYYKFDKMLQNAPQEVLQFIQDNICLSQSGHHSKAEGGDFILESVNKKIKAWLPPGVPTQERWTRVCRNINSMEKMKHNITHKLGEDDNNDEQTTYFRTLKQDDAVQALQTKLLPYLLQEHLVSLDNKPLDHDIIYF